MTAAEVMALLSRKGQSITLTLEAAGDYDPATSSATLTESMVTTVGVVLPIARGVRFASGSTIEAGDQQLLLPGDIDEPALNTKATIGGTDYVIVEVSPLAPDGDALIYDCIIRGVR